MTDTITTPAPPTVSTEFTQACEHVCHNTGTLETWKALADSHQEFDPVGLVLDTLVYTLFPLLSTALPPS